MKERPVIWRGHSSYGRLTAAGFAFQGVGTSLRVRVLSRHNLSLGDA